MKDFLENEVRSFDATVLRSKANNLNDSEKKIIDTLDKFSDFLKSYKEMSPEEQTQFSNLIGQITYGVGVLTILVNNQK